MTFYKHHVFFCNNQRDGGRECCENHDSSRLRAYAKKKLQDLDMSGEGKVRINQAGCLDRCSLGPVLVVYPEETWYTYVDESDIDQIIDDHLINNKVVERLVV